VGVDERIGGAESEKFCEKNLYELNFNRSTKIFGVGLLCYSDVYLFCGDDLFF
jgi:hypothetical protein